MEIGDSWGLEFLWRGELEKWESFLGDTDHWIADIFRGRIASLSLRVLSAESWFAAAKRKAVERSATLSPEHAILLLCYSIENILLFERSESRLRKILTATRWTLDGASDEHFSELRLLSAVQAKVLLRLGEIDLARRAFRALLETDPLPEQASLYLSGLACCQLQVDKREPRILLEHAGIFASAGRTPYGQGVAASTLVSCYQYLDLCLEAERWEQFISVLPIPTSTQEALKRRSDLVLSLSERAQLMLSI